jgi:hypothetical protein
MQDPEASLLHGLWEAREILVYSFDFDLVDPPSEPEWFSVPNADCYVVARDATGGVYATCTLRTSGAQYCIHVDTGGGSCVIARTELEAIALVVALPYWRDILRYSSGGALNEMRLVADELERDVLEDFPDLPLVRDHVRASIPLQELEDPVGLLHELAVRSPSDVSVLGPHGWPCQSLVGQSSPADYLHWNRPTH